MYIVAAYLVVISIHSFVAPFYIQGLWGPSALGLAMFGLYYIIALIYLGAVIAVVLDARNRNSSLVLPIGIMIFNTVLFTALTSLMLQGLSGWCERPYYSNNCEQGTLNAIAFGVLLVTSLIMDFVLFKDRKGIKQLYRAP